MTKSECLGIIKENDTFAKMREYIKPYLTNLDLVRHIDFNTLFFLQDDEIIFEFDLTQNTDGSNPVYVNYDLWQSFYYRFDLNYDDCVKFFRAILNKYTVRSIVPWSGEAYANFLTTQDFSGYAKTLNYVK